MLRRSVIKTVLPALALAQLPAIARGEERLRMRVVRDPGCACCLGWVRHMEQAGFAVSVEERPRADPSRRSSGAPSHLAGCHTAFHDRFAFEGHVPAAAVRRFLTDPGSWRGLAVPKMPIGSPGMEVAGATPETFEIIKYDQTGRTELYARARGSEII